MSLYREHVLAAEEAGSFVCLGVELGIKDDLCYTCLVPELYKDDSSKVTAAAKPSV